MNIAKCFLILLIMVGGGCALLRKATRTNQQHALTVERHARGKQYQRMLVTAHRATNGLFLFGWSDVPEVNRKSVEDGPAKDYDDNVVEKIVQPHLGNDYKFPDKFKVWAKTRNAFALAEPGTPFVAILMSDGTIYGLPSKPIDDTVLDYNVGAYSMGGGANTMTLPPFVDEHGDTMPGLKVPKVKDGNNRVASAGVDHNPTQNLQAHVSACHLIVGLAQLEQPLTGAQVVQCLAGFAFSKGPAPGEACVAFKSNSLNTPRVTVSDITPEKFNSINPPLGLAKKLVATLEKELPYEGWKGKKADAPIKWVEYMSSRAEDGGTRVPGCPCTSRSACNMKDNTNDWTVEEVSDVFKKCWKSCLSQDETGAKWTEKLSQEVADADQAKAAEYLHDFRNCEQTYWPEDLPEGKQCCDIMALTAMQRMALKGQGILPKSLVMASKLFPKGMIHVTDEKVTDAQNKALYNSQQTPTQLAFERRKKQNEVAKRNKMTEKDKAALDAAQKAIAEKLKDGYKPAIRLKAANDFLLDKVAPRAPEHEVTSVTLEDSKTELKATVYCYPNEGASSPFNQENQPGKNDKKNLITKDGKDGEDATRHVGKCPVTQALMIAGSAGGSIKLEGPFMICDAVRAKNIDQCPKNTHPYMEAYRNMNAGGTDLKKYQPACYFEFNFARASKDSACMDVCGPRSGYPSRHCMSESWVSKIEHVASEQLGIEKWYAINTGSSKICDTNRDRILTNVRSSAEGYDVRENANTPQTANEGVVQAFNQRRANKDNDKMRWTQRVVPDELVFAPDFIREWKDEKVLDGEFFVCTILLSKKP